MEKKKVAVICTAIAVTAAIVSGMFVYFWMASQQRSNEIRIEQSGNYETLSKYLRLGDLENIINQYYYKEAEQDDLVNGALRGMVGALGDPFSAYYTEDEYTSYLAEMEGTNVGIGAAFAPVAKTSGLLRVKRVYGGGPAETAGITPDDIIIGVDGVGLDDLDYDGATALISGPSGSSVVLTVQRNGEARNVELTRANVDAPAVSYTMLDDAVGLIVINSFSGDCVEEFRNALLRLKEEEGARAVVIDLRGNMTGTVAHAVEILDEIVPRGLLLYSIDRNGARSEWEADSSYDDIPLAVIVDSGTASAAEVFAAAIQQRGRGSIIGQTTYGKGVEQAVEQMPYGAGGGVKLTTAEYYTADGDTINGVGVEPDEVVQMPAEGVAVTLSTDPQIQTAKDTVRSILGG